MNIKLQFLNNGDEIGYYIIDGRLASHRAATESCLYASRNHVCVERIRERLQHGIVWALGLRSAYRAFDRPLKMKFFYQKYRTP